MDRLNMPKLFKIAVNVPEAEADDLRKAIGDSGGGRVGNYTHCSFSFKGTGRFLPMDGANPTIGQVGKLEQVPEEHIEVTCEEDKLNSVVSAIKSAHPYEEPAIEIYPMHTLDES